MQPEESKRFEFVPGAEDQFSPVPGAEDQFRTVPNVEDLCPERLEDKIREGVELSINFLSVGSSYEMLSM